jgi:hypothetical protein
MCCKAPATYMGNQKEDEQGHSRQPATIGGWTILGIAIAAAKDENDTEISRTKPQSFSTFNPIEFVFCGQKQILNSKTKYGVHNSEFGMKSVLAFVRSISTFLHYIWFRTEFKFGLEPNLVQQENSDLTFLHYIRFRTEFKLAGEL